MQHYIRSPNRPHILISAMFQFDLRMAKQTQVVLQQSWITADLCDVPLMYSKLSGIMGWGCTQTSHHLQQKQRLMWRPAVINLSVVVRAINGHSTTNGRAMPRLMRLSTFSSVLSATASGAHPHPPTHARHRTVMSLGLMHRKTQLQGKNVSLPSRVEAFACTREFTLSVWILKRKADQPCIYIVLSCVACCSEKPNRADSSSQKPSDLWPDGLV